MIEAMKDKFLTAAKKLFDRDLLNKDSMYVFLTAFIAGLWAHAYQFFGKYPNYDEYISMFHYGGGYGLGRWFLAILGNIIFRIDGCFSLPWFNGVIYLALLSGGIVLFVACINMKSRVMKCLIAALFATFPSTTATLTYMFTAPFYALSLFLVALAFYISVKTKYGWILGGIFICFAMGIYQAYFTLAAVFVLVYTILKLLSEEEFKNILIKACCQLGMLVIGIAGYFVTNKLVLSLRNETLSGYQGISNMGQTSAGSLFQGIADAYKGFFDMFTSDYIKMIPYGILNVAICIIWIVAIAYLIYMLAGIFKKEVFKGIFLVVCIAMIPFGLCMAHVMCAGTGTIIHGVMLQTVSFIYIFPVIVLDRVLQSEYRLADLFVLVYGAVLAIVLFMNIKFANVTYLSYQLRYEQSYSYFQTLRTAIQCTENYSPEYPVAFIGHLPDTGNDWELRYSVGLPGFYTVDNILNYGGTREGMFHYFLGYYYGEVYADESILNSSEFKEMPCYPAYGSIRVIDDVVAVKFSEE